MNIGIIGAGNVGSTLGAHWSAAGHAVRYGVRNPGPSAFNQAPVPAVGAWAEVIVLATPWEAVADAIAACGDTTGKIIVDCTNPLLPRLAGLELGTTTSGGEKVASLAPGARVVKAFNTVGFNIMANPVLANGRRASLPYCGDDEAAKATVRQLAEQCGFDAYDAGPLKQARLLEPFALLWISLAMQYGYGRQIAFDFLRS